jgi:lipopolysaccharide O-acetyltransferase
MQENLIIKEKRYKPTKYEMYGFIGLLRLLTNFIRTKLFYPFARIIHFPFQVKGKKYISFGLGFSAGSYCKIEAYPYLNQGKIIKFGKNVRINNFSHISGICSIAIGDNVLMASRIYISDLNHGSYNGDENDSDPESIFDKRLVTGKPIVIEDNVWLGESVSVLSGVTIGRCSVIGSNSVVTKNIPPYTIAVGTPAKPIKRFDFDNNRWVKI